MEVERITVKVEAASVPEPELPDSEAEATCNVTTRETPDTDALRRLREGEGGRMTTKYDDQVSVWTAESDEFLGTGQLDWSGRPAAHATLRNINFDITKQLEATLRLELDRRDDLFAFVNSTQSGAGPANLTIAQ